MVKKESERKRDMTKLGEITQPLGCTVDAVITAGGKSTTIRRLCDDPNCPQKK